MAILLEYSGKCLKTPKLWYKNIFKKKWIPQILLPSTLKLSPWFWHNQQDHLHHHNHDHNLLQIHSSSALPAGEKEDTGWLLYIVYYTTINWDPLSFHQSPKSFSFEILWAAGGTIIIRDGWMITSYVSHISPYDSLSYIWKSFEERGDMDEWSTCFRCSVPVHKNIGAKPILFSLGIVFFKQILAKSGPLNRISRIVFEKIWKYPYSSIGNFRPFSK